MKIPGKFLVKSNRKRDNDCVGNILKSTVSLSFWGGIDPLTGVVIDVSHPLARENVSQSILCLPSGRGSSTASQVLLELILNGIAPRAIVLRDVDGLVAVGALVAQEIFGSADLDVIAIGEEGFDRLIQSGSKLAMVLPDGSIGIGNSASDILNQKINFSVPADVKLTATEEAMLQNCDTEAQQLSLRVLFRYAHIIMETTSYLPVSKAHIDGCTYIGPGGLEFVQRLVNAGGKVSVPTTLNAMSTDRQRWQLLGVPSMYAKNAIALGDGYIDLGCQPSFTCAPYLLQDAPKLGENLVWGESNAVVFANSVLGARTDKCADYLDICCAITGLVPATGVQLDENRKPTIVLDTTDIINKINNAENISFDMLFPILGHLCGTVSDGKVPLVLGLDRLNRKITVDHLKSLCAAFGTTGSSPLIHLAGVTPEATTNVVGEWIAGGMKSIKLTEEMLEETYRSLDSDQSNDEKVQLVALGNPHLSVTECKEIVEILQDYLASHPVRKKDDVRIIACMSRELQMKAKDAGFLEPLEKFGIEFVNDTCWCMLLDEPIIPIDRNARILTNSGKYAHYGPGLTNRSFRFGSMADCIHAAVSGSYLRRSSNTGKIRTLLSTDLHKVPQKRLYSQEVRKVLGCLKRAR